MVKFRFRYALSRYSSKDQNASWPIWIHTLQSAKMLWIASGHRCLTETAILIGRSNERTHPTSKRSWTWSWSEVLLSLFLYIYLASWHLSSFHPDRHLVPHIGLVKKVQKLIWIWIKIRSVPKIGRVYLQPESAHRYGSNIHNSKIVTHAINQEKNSNLNQPSVDPYSDLFALLFRACLFYTVAQFALGRHT